MVELRPWLFISALLVALATAESGLSADEELPVLIRSFRAVEASPPPFNEGRFEPRVGETIAFLGGTNTFDQERHGFLERRFYLAWPERALRIRNLAWQGDVLNHQPRPRNFYTRKGDPQPGSIPDHRERTEPGIIFLNFGKMESLDGTAAFEDYEALVTDLKALTPRLILVAPTPFFPVGPAASLTEGRNARLAELVAVIRQTAEKHELLFVDLFTPLRENPDPSLSANGVHLTEAGHRHVAELIADQLQFPPASESRVPASAALEDSLAQAIERKSRLWQQYYRPTNWAFLFGDRQHVPASRDPVERDQRWFVREIDALPGLIAEAEADIHRYAKALTTSSGKEER